MNTKMKLAAACVAAATGLLAADQAPKHFFCKYCGLNGNFSKFATLIGSSGVSPESFLKVQLPQYALSHVGQLTSLTNLISTWLFAIFFSVCFLVRPLKTRRIVDEFSTLPILSKENWNFLGKRNPVVGVFNRIMGICQGTD